MENGRLRQKEPAIPQVGEPGGERGSFPAAEVTSRPAVYCLGGPAGRRAGSGGASLHVCSYTARPGQNSCAVCPMPCSVRSYVKTIALPATAGRELSVPPGWQGGRSTLLNPMHCRRAGRVGRSPLRRGRGGVGQGPKKRTVTVQFLTKN